jgi:hypothetical protein
VIFREPIPSPSRRVSGSASSLAASCEEVEWQTAPRFLARTAALLRARDAMRVVFAGLEGLGLVLSA